MSYRATYITKFLYKHEQDEEIEQIKFALERYCRTVIWQGDNGVGYFHGIIKGLWDGETQSEEKEIVENLKGHGIEIVINHE